MNLSISESTNTNSLDRSVRPNRFEGLTILAVDDEADSLDILTIVLEGEGANVISATSATAALEVFERTTPDVIVSDIGMPDIDGYILIEEIRKLPQARGISAIALTAYGAEIDVRQSLNSGYQRHLAKPIDIPRLIATITELL